MAVHRRTAVDTIIANIFRYVLLFGLTTHVYDTKRHRLVHSRKAHCYSLSLHVAFVGLAPVFFVLSESGELLTLGRGYLFENLLTLLVIMKMLSMFASICLQWAIRRNAATLFNEIIQIWHKDVVHLPGSREIRQQAARLFIFKALTSALITAHAAYGTCSAVDFYTLLLSNIPIAVMCLFCSGLVFSQYIFRILNFNLVRLVEDIGRLCSAQGPHYDVRHELAVLEQRLGEIGRIHAQLQEWVVRFKNIYQVELVLFITMFLLLQVVVLFVLCLVIRVGMVGPVLLHFLGASSAAIWNALDLILLCYICGGLLDASDEAGHIMRTLLASPGHGLCSEQLERCVELVCFQLNTRKLRLRVCGLVDLDWSKGFAMSETALLYILLLIQTDYERLWK